MEIPDMALAVKDSLKVRAGQFGAAKRWGTPVTVRIDDLHPAVREAVLALLRAGKAASAKKAPDQLVSDALEVNRVAARPTPTSRS